MHLKALYRPIFMMAICGALSVLLLAGPAPTYAVSPITQTLIANNGLCNLNYHEISGTTTLNYTVPADLNVYLYVNSAQVAGPLYFPITVQSGTGPWNFAYFIGPFGTADYTIEWEWIYTVGGQDVWRNTAGYECIAGTPTNYYTTEQDLTPPPVPVPPASAPVGPPAPGLPADRNLVLFTGTVPVLRTPGGDVIGETLYTCQTGFIIEISEDGDYGRVFVMGGWVPLSATIDVGEDYGQPGGAPRLPGC